MEGNGIQPVMNVGSSGYGYNDGFGFGGAGLWLFAILALMWGGNGFGWGNNGFANAIGYENLATSNEVQRGFDNQNTMANQREILSAVNAGTAQAVSATNEVFHNTINALSDKYSELQRDVASVQVGQANALANQNQCCGNTLRAIDSVNYNNALNTASINANTTASMQKVLDAITTNKIESLQSKVNALELAQATQNIVRYPTAMTYAYPANPFCSGCGCGSNF